MTIDWVNFTPFASLAGGLMIGLAAALLIFFDGRILGVSGIVAGLLRRPGGEAMWRVAFLLGVLAAPALLFLAAPAGLVEAPRIDASFAVVGIAGLLVGFGTRCGSGCTSGHGVCGVARASPRSLVATAAFMVAGFLTVYLLRHLF